MSRRHRELVHELALEITTGERREGESLPREIDLAERFDVSRGVARETLRALEERGLVRVKHGRGATVCPASEWNTLDAEVMAGLLAGPRGPAVLADALECLRVVEPEAAALAAERASPQDLRGLSQALERIEEGTPRTKTNAAKAARAGAAEVAFHSALMRATHNPSIVRIGEPLHQALRMAREAWLGAKDTPVRRKKDYKRILEAIAHDDADGARAATRRCLDMFARELEVPPGQP